MNTRLLLLAGSLALSGALVASAKTYDIKFWNPTQAGNTVLRAGDYRLKVEGDTAVLTDRNSAKKFTAPVKIENAARKHDQTAVEVRSQNGTDQLRAIELGGSTATLEFHN